MPFGLSVVEEGDSLGDKEIATLVAGHKVRPAWYNARSTRMTYLWAGVDVDDETNPKRGDLERDFDQTSRSRVEMSAGQRISPNDANLSEIGGFKDKF